MNICKKIQKKHNNNGIRSDYILTSSYTILFIGTYTEYLSIYLKTENRIQI